MIDELAGLVEAPPRGGESGHSGFLEASIDSIVDFLLVTSFSAQYFYPCSPFSPFAPFAPFSPFSPFLPPCVWGGCCCEGLLLRVVGVVVLLWLLAFNGRLYVFVYLF